MSWDHSYGLFVSDREKNPLQSGYTTDEANVLYKQMEKLYDIVKNGKGSLYKISLEYSLDTYGKPLTSAEISSMQETIKDWMPIGYDIERMILPDSDAGKVNKYDVKIEELS